jgi:hypothetical protein
MTASKAQLVLVGAAQIIADAFHVTSISSHFLRNYIALSHNRRSNPRPDNLLTRNADIRQAGSANCMSGHAQYAQIPVIYPQSTRILTITSALRSKKQLVILYHHPFATASFIELPKHHS